MSEPKAAEGAPEPAPPARTGPGGFLGWMRATRAEKDAWVEQRRAAALDPAAPTTTEANRAPDPGPLRVEVVTASPARLDEAPARPDARQQQQQPKRR